MLHLTEVLPRFTTNFQMRLKKLSLRVRIFFAMILLVIIASILIAAVTIYQYNEEARDYHRERLERKEHAIISDIDYVIKETTYPVETEKIPLIFKDDIYKDFPASDPRIL